MGIDTSVWLRLIRTQVAHLRSKYEECYWTFGMVHDFTIVAEGGPSLIGNEAMAAQLAASVEEENITVTFAPARPGFESIGPSFQLRRTPSADEQQLETRWAEYLVSAVAAAERNGLAYHVITAADLEKNGCSRIPVVAFDFQVNREGPPERYYSSFPWTARATGQFKDSTYKVYTREIEPGQYAFVLNRRELPPGFDSDAVIAQWVNFLRTELEDCRQSRTIYCCYDAQQLTAAGCSVILCRTLANCAIAQIADEFPEFEIYVHTYDRYSGTVEDEYFTVVAKNRLRTST